MSTLDTAPAAAIGHWLPKDRSILQSWLKKELGAFRRDKRALRGNVELDESLQKLKAVVDGNRTLSQQSKDMFTQIPPGWNDGKTPNGQDQLMDFDEMLGFINDRVFKRGPPWYYIEGDDWANDMIGFPINAILDWPMGTEAGYCFFRDLNVNEAWKGVLNVWGDWLKTSDSRSCLDRETGWLSSKAQGVITDAAGGSSFELTFKCDPSDEYYGFKSWDDFFVRQFQDGVREIPSTDQGDTILCSCESMPLEPPTVSPARKQDSYWVKGHPYSLADMLNNDEDYVDQFVGGTIYQAFLSAKSYHCWHAPVDGVVLKVCKVDGTYYSEAKYEGFPNPDPAGPNLSQQYISNVATRGIIYINATNPPIGLMAIVYIGMAEVSSCDFTTDKGETIKEGDPIKKGDSIGAFHFGGSSHCILFRPGIEVNLLRDPNETANNRVKSELAIVIDKNKTK